MEKTVYFGDSEIRPEPYRQLSGHRAAHNDWPLSSRYYDPLTMDAAQILALISDDTDFVQSGFPWHIDYIYLDEQGQPQRCRADAGDVHDDGIFSSSVLDSPLAVVHIRQSRLYMGSKTVSCLALDGPTWLALLRRFDVIPGYLELLHSNNGGTMLHISEAACRSSTDLSAESELASDRPQAFHIGYKTGIWSSNENSIYARCDFDTGRSLVLLFGTDLSASLDRVQQMLVSDPNASFLHVVHALQNLHLTYVEKARWNLDYRVRELESDTGVAFFQTHSLGPLRPEELQFNKKLTVTDEHLCNAAWGSKRVRLHFSAFLKHLTDFQRLHEASSPHQLKVRELRNLQNSCKAKIELAESQYEQIQELRGRIRNQLEVTASLMAQRDTQVNIEIGKATKKDSELMRGIAGVTMVFLPATFAATFFSMVFFHVGDEKSVRLTVDRKIWLYPVVTVPLTVVIAVWYLAWSLDWSWTAVFGVIQSDKKKTDIGGA